MFSLSHPSAALSFLPSSGSDPYERPPSYVNPSWGSSGSDLLGQATVLHQGSPNPVQSPVPHSGPPVLLPLQGHMPSLLCPSVFRIDFCQERKGRDEKRRVKINRKGRGMTLCFSISFLKLSGVQSNGLPRSP